MVSKIHGCSFDISFGKDPLDENGFDSSPDSPIHGFVAELIHDFPIPPPSESSLSGSDPKPDAIPSSEATGGTSFPPARGIPPLDIPSDWLPSSSIQRPSLPAIPSLPEIVTDPLKIETLSTEERLENAVCVLKRNPKAIRIHVARTYNVTETDLREMALKEGIPNPGIGAYRQNYDKEAMKRALEKVKKFQATPKVAAEEEKLTVNALQSRMRANKIKSWLGKRKKTRS